MQTTNVATDAPFDPSTIDVGGSYRPALVKLVLDVRESEKRLIDGLDSRRDALLWTQQLAVRTLGEMPNEWFAHMADQFRCIGDDATERFQLSAMLTKEARQRDFDEAVAQEYRRQMVAKIIRPAAHRAYRELRSDAGEYVSDGQTDKHAPGKQQYVAMRPSIDEMFQSQRDTLESVLDGFESREQILDWGHDLELATHGEIDEAFVTRCYAERSTRRVLTGTGWVPRRARELFAAEYLIPVFNEGIRDLSGRAKESPDEVIEQTNVELA